MKTLVILVLLGGLIALGGSFFGVWVIPGLETFPTAERVGKSRAGSIQREAERRYQGEEEPPQPVRWGAPQDGSLGTRTEQLRKSERNLGN